MFIYHQQIQDIKFVRTFGHVDLICDKLRNNVTLVMIYMVIVRVPLQTNLHLIKNIYQLVKGCKNVFVITYVLRFMCL